MDNTVTFWLGLTLSIPIAIIVNLITPSLQKYIATANTNQRRRLQKSREKERVLAEKLSTNQTAAITYLIGKNNLVIRTLISALWFFIASNYLILMARFYLPIYNRPWLRVLGDIGGFLGLIVSVGDIIVALNATRTVTYIHNYILSKEESRTENRVTPTE